MNKNQTAPIQIHVDMQVDPAKEEELVHQFETVFRPTAMTFNGYVDLSLLKLRSAVVGQAPPGVNYRFCLTYETEELRQKWIASEVHGQVWGALERTLLSSTYDVLLFDVI